MKRLQSCLEAGKELPYSRHARLPAPDPRQLLFCGSESRAGVGAPACFPSFYAALSMLHIFLLQMSSPRVKCRGGCLSYGDFLVLNCYILQYDSYLPQKKCCKACLCYLVASQGATCVIDVPPAARIRMTAFQGRPTGLPFLPIAARRQGCADLRAQGAQAIAPK